MCRHSLDFVALDKTRNYREPNVAMEDDYLPISLNRLLVHMLNDFHS
jgi:hypothetical protein